MNIATETMTRSNEPAPTEHSAIFDSANRPLRLGQNVFEDLDSVADRHRLHNIVGGWVANDGSEMPSATVINREPEASTGEWKRAHRRQSNGRVRFQRRGKGRDREPSKSRPNDHEGFGDVVDFLEEVFTLPADYVRI
jgi:hypothetical protein